MCLKEKVLYWRTLYPIFLTIGICVLFGRVGLLVWEDISEGKS
jgi:hypothetical protein